MRLLQSLWLDLCKDGRGYHPVGRGIASSGGCPQLFHFRVEHIHRNLDWLALEPHLIAPSVRDLHIYARGTEEEVLLACCGLVRMGYRYLLTDQIYRIVDVERSPFVQACISTLLRDVGGMHVPSLGYCCALISDEAEQ
jgi:hypothetical protein